MHAKHIPPYLAHKEAWINVSNYHRHQLSDFPKMLRPLLSRRPETKTRAPPTLSLPSTPPRPDEASLPPGGPTDLPLSPGRGYGEGQGKSDCFRSEGAWTDTGPFRTPACGVQAASGELLP